MSDDGDEINDNSENDNSEYDISDCSDDERPRKKRKSEDSGQKLVNIKINDLLYYMIGCSLSN